MAKRPKKRKKSKNKIKKRKIKSSLKKTSHNEDEIIKKTKEIKHLPLIKQSRLSVMPIDFKSWKIIYNMGRI